MKFLLYLLCCFSIVYPQTNKGTDGAMLKTKNREYPKTKIKPLLSCPLSDSLRETSGLVFFDGLFWTHNDDHDTTLYGLDSLGKIREKITLDGVTNTDWEAITQDSSHLYIGDFGNNLSGNRRNLRILKIEKTSFLQQQPIIETITFTYENQVDFSAQKPNKTEWDCEAFIVTQDSIYLFTKQWKSSNTSIYVLPNTGGNHTAKLKSTWNSEGLVTDATYWASKNILALCGYSKKGKTFLYLIYDFKNNDFLSGNRRRIPLRLRFHQIEGITTIDGNTFYLTNEALVRKPFLRIPQQWHVVELKDNNKK